MGGKKGAPFCVHGHEIAVVGRIKNGECRACKQVRNRVVSGRRHPEGTIKVSSRPLLAHIDALPWPIEVVCEKFASRWGVSPESARTNLARMRRRYPTIRSYTADEWCLALGTFLVEVYPELYFEEAEGVA